MKGRRVLVTGATGMLGTDLVAALEGLGAQVWAFGRRELDITDRDAVDEAVARAAPEWVVNCAAFTKVDDCEREQELALAVNGRGPGNLAAACARHGAALLHISTDYVFDGTARRPYMEGDPVCPVSAYGRSKLAGEEAVEKGGCPYLIVRTAWLFGRNGPNFIDTILGLFQRHGRLRVVDDQAGSPTYTPDLAQALIWLMEAEGRGVVHVVNSGCCSWFQFAQEAVRMAGGDPSRVEPVGSEEFPRPAPRPAYSVLHTGRFRAVTGRTLRPWQEALAEYIAIRGGISP